ncbi:MgtC/SapB family protein [Pseudothauera rhizosphaerae]|uniref:Protein MgtC n=1 Tax=Pseudothauera rhizosphaerae TaxID=2565932 RepID=A0A4S4AYF9_9RHOO|nr:MgtC/SapB family protein [Pseudothauera rhizosphaerae]THF65176.1 MgtC/SapB family protein [Pseudothauera rhizosphaerae]
MNTNFADYPVVALHLGAALAAGAVIGLERSFHARPAGFRTHTLVCLASSLLMLVTLFQWQWLPGVPLDTVRTDPTRMAQGIMTGIGFLGAGVIFKEGLSVRGLTTAASIWMTAAIGILFGVGFLFPALLATVMTLGILSAFRWIEARMPSQAYAHCMLRFARDDVMSEPELRELLTRHGFTLHNLSYRLDDDGTAFEYRMVIRSSKGAGSTALSEYLLGLERVRSFRISPTGD